MSNKSEDQSLSSWTMASATGTTMSLTKGNGTPGSDPNSLTLSVIPRYESIGQEYPIKKTEVCINVKAVDIDSLLDNDSDDARVPVDIVVALDLSGSMNQDEKLESCKTTLQIMLTNLKSTDRFGLITYAEDAKVEISIDFVTSANKASALEKIRNLKATGRTNLSGGLTTAQVELETVKNPNTVRSIFLLTDGHANKGQTSTDELVTLVRSFAGKSTLSLDSTNKNQGSKEINGMMEHTTLSSTDVTTTGTKPDTILIVHNNDKSAVGHAAKSISTPISLFCFGYGNDHNSEMLQAISNETDGAYYFVEQGSDSDVAAAFGDAIGGLLSVVAQSAVVTLTIPDDAKAAGVKILKVHHEDAIQRDEHTYTVNLGDFYSEESRDVLVDLQLANNVPGLGAIVHGKVSLTYSDTIGKSGMVSIGPVPCLVSRPNNNKVSPANPHVEEQCNRVRFLERMKESNALAEAGRHDDAVMTMERHKVDLESCFKAGSVSDEFYSGMMKEVNSTSIGLSSAQMYSSSGAHTMRRQLKCHTKQRCMKSSSSPWASGGGMYSSKRKERTTQLYDMMKNGKASDQAAAAAAEPMELEEGRQGKKVHFASKRLTSKQR